LHFCSPFFFLLLFHAALGINGWQTTINKQAGKREINKQSANDTAKK